MNEVNREELVAATRYNGVVRPKLPTEAQEYLQDRLEQGATFVQVLREAEVMWATMEPGEAAKHGSHPSKIANGTDVTEARIQQRHEREYATQREKLGLTDADLEQAPEVKAFFERLEAADPGLQHRRERIARENFWRGIRAAAQERGIFDLRSAMEHAADLQTMQAFAPTTQRELMELQQSDRRTYDRLMNATWFDITKVR